MPGTVFAPSFFLGDVTTCPHKPFDLLAEELISPESRGERI